MKKLDLMKSLWRPVLFTALIGVIAISVASAQLGTVLTSFSPTPVGNGRALAHDPVTGNLFFTNGGDPNIYVVTTNNVPVATLTSGINFGALSWDAKRGVLWGGAYDGTGNVYTITPAGVATFKFTFTTTDSCYGAFADKFYDGVAYDEGPTLADSDDSLWLSGDNAKTLYHVDLSGKLISSSAIPSGRCNTGIAADGKYLWLALQSGPDTPPYDIVRVDKANPTVVLSSFQFSATNPGPEGINLDVTTFPGKCALWSNQFGTNTIKAWELEPGIEPECPPTLGIDISTDTPTFTQLTNFHNNYPQYRFVIVDTWTYKLGHIRGPMPDARENLKNARLAGYKTAAYVVIDFETSYIAKKSIEQQVQEAINNIDNTATKKGVFVPGEKNNISFMAIDLEYIPQTYDINTVIKGISNAIEILKQNNIKPVIYTRKGYWNSYFKGVTAFSNIPLWESRYGTDKWPGDPDLIRDFDIKSKSEVYWTSFGGWQGRVGKQYLDQDGVGNRYSKYGLNSVDIDSFYSTMFDR